MKNSDFRLNNNTQTSTCEIILQDTSKTPGSELSDPDLMGPDLFLVNMTRSLSQNDPNRGQTKRKLIALTTFRVTLT